MNNLLILAMLVLTTGCAPTMKMIVNGHAYPTKWVGTTEEIDKDVSKETKATQLLKDTVTEVGTNVTYMNTKYLSVPAGYPVITMKGGGWEDSVGAKLTFNRKVETIKLRNGIEEKSWIRDVLNSVLKDNPLVYETCKPYWTSRNSVSSAENNIVYSKDLKNFSVITDFTIIGILFSEKTKELPLDDVCSVKSAEFYLAEIAKAAAAKTEEYINK